jgi:3-hydroxyisobutyrate dehydrogenase-like beta-hydroxyacid dehydrogenase
VFDAVIKGGRMDCLFYQTFSRYAIGRDRNAHKFTLVNALKDLSYLAGAAQALSIANPVGAAVRNSYAQAVATGHGGDYVPMLSDHVAQWSGTKLTE